VSKISWEGENRIDGHEKYDKNFVQPEPAKPVGPDPVDLGFEQVGSYLGVHTGRDANMVTKAARDPQRTSKTQPSSFSLSNVLVSPPRTDAPSECFIFAARKLTHRRTLAAAKRLCG